MASTPTDRQKTDQIIAECLVKAAHVVLGSRSEPNKPSVHQQARKSWFNLNIDEVDVATQVFEHWRKDTGTPAFIEVYLRPWGASEEQSPPLQHSPSQPQDIRLQSDAFPSATLLERWMFHFEPAMQDGNLQRRRAQLARLDPPAVYKRAVVMLRSLTSYVRLLPGYRMYRACKRNSSSPARLGFCLLKGHQSNTERTDLAQRPSSGLRRHSWSREVVRISPPSPSALTPFASGGRPPLGVPIGSHDAALMPSPSLPVPSLEQGQMSPLPLPRMQRTTSTPSQPQSLSSWRPELPEEATQDSDPASSPQGFSQQPLPSSSPTVHGMPSRTPSYQTSGTEPVCIPNSKPRVFSSNDLTSIGTGAWSGCATGAAAGPPETVMVRQYGFPSCQGSAPSSAPASTGFVPPTAHRQVGLLKAVAAKPPLSGSPSSAAGGMLPPTPPNAAYQPMPGSSDAGSSTSSATFPYLPSGSPQLPFAFTPSPHSLPTLAGQGSMRSSYLSPSPPISGRDISALAVIRRPSWSGAARTASYDGGSATAAGTQAGNVGSPMQDSLDSSFFGSAAAKHMLKPGGGTLYPVLSGNKPLVLPATGHGGSSSASYTAPRLTYPQEPDLAGLHAEESESDILPFAIDGDAGAPLNVTSPSADAQTGGLSSAEAVVKWLEAG
ncbi:hypothetical protein WJX79_004130 [Trebouxia sp. C0005]